MSVRRQDTLPKRRGIRVKGKTSLKKILANEREAVKNLARLINCNFGPGDMWLTLTYSDDRLPASIEDAAQDFAKTLRKLRAMVKKETGKNPGSFFLLWDLRKKGNSGEGIPPAGPCRLFETGEWLFLHYICSRYHYL